MDNPNRHCSKIIELGDHIEMEHERELPGFWNFIQLYNMHYEMHQMRDHWDHDHS